MQSQIFSTPIEMIQVQHRACPSGHAIRVYSLLQLLATVAAVYRGFSGAFGSILAYGTSNEAFARFFAGYRPTAAGTWS